MILSKDIGVVKIFQLKMFWRHPPGVLWKVAPNLVLFLFAYTAMGTFLTTSVFGKKLMQLTYIILQREGDLRFNLVRTRENAGAIFKI